MIVVFNPMINTGADVNAAYMNFLRCVTAIATASAGTSSLTVNPFTNNTGTIDNTRNCIVSIIANTEGGGWTTSASHNVVNSGSFTAIASAAGGLYKADFYNASGKGSYPFMKLSFHTTSNSSGNSWGVSGYKAPFTSFATYPHVSATFGCHTVSDWSVVSGYVPGGSATLGTLFNSGTQTTSASIFEEGSSTQPPNTNNYTHRSFAVNQSTVNFYMAVTANYCIIWEQHTSNSYNNGYNNIIPMSGNFLATSVMSGSLGYMGLRETQAWENSLSTNPPWVTFEINHNRLANFGGSFSGFSSPSGVETFYAYMATVNDSGVTTTTATKYGYINNWNVSYHFSDMRTQQNSLGLMPLFGHGRDFGTVAAMGSYSTNQSFMPVVDSTTGTAVPSAYPIMVRRSTTGSWNPGGAVRGLYKSLNMPIATMRNYFANGQTFSIYNSVTQTTDTYLPIVFNETMYLVRYA